MTPRLLAAIQSRILDLLKVATEGAHDSEIASWGGVERSEVSRWRSGERRMTVDHLRGLILGSGDARAVLQPLADMGDCDLVPRRTQGEGNAVVSAHLVIGETGRVLAALAEACADHRIDRDESRRLGESLDRLDDKIASLRHDLARVSK